MPYATTEDLPDSVRHHLPPHAQAIYLEAFNHAWEDYADPERRRSGSQEETAHRVAWAAVKRVYRKEGSDWVEKE